MSRTASGPSDVDGPNEAESLPASVIDDLLESPRRRRLLEVLVGSDRPLPVADLATALKEAETGSDCDRLRTEIYQDHLPKLVATGVVRFDSLLGVVEFSGSQSVRARLSALVDGDAGTKDK